MTSAAWIGAAATALTMALCASPPLAAQSEGRPGYDEAFIGPPLADPVVQHAKETYVLFGCAYCHGVNLVPRGEATDLRQSAIVGRDVDADVIGPLLRAGIPQTAKLSPMPQFSDLSDHQIRALALWIHVARGEARYNELTAASLPAGNATRGRADFAARCQSCHTAPAFARIGAKYDARTLLAQLLKPGTLSGERSYRLDRLADAAARTARQRHQTFLENARPDEVSDLVAYLTTLR